MAKQNWGKLFKNHWINHDELLRRLAKNPKPYLQLSYWSGQLNGKPVFFITNEDQPPDAVGDPRFHWDVLDWQRLGNPSEAEGILTEHMDAEETGRVRVPVDVHWHIQIKR